MGYLIVTTLREAYSRGAMEEEELRELMRRDDWGMAVFLKDRENDDDEDE